LPQYITSQTDDRHTTDRQTDRRNTVAYWYTNISEYKHSRLR